MSPAVREGCCPIFSGLSFSTTVVEAEEGPTLPCRRGKTGELQRHGRDWGYREGWEARKGDLKRGGSGKMVEVSRV